MRIVTTVLPQCFVTEPRRSMGIQSLYKGILLVLVVQIQGKANANETTTGPSKQELLTHPPPPPPLPPSKDNSLTSEEDLTEVDLSVHPGWWFPPVQFEHVVLEPNNSSEEITNPDSIIIGGDISFVPLIITKDPPGTVYFYSYNTTNNGTDVMNGTSFIEIDEAYVEIANNGSVVEDDYESIILFPADDITSEILSPAMVANGTMSSTTVMPELMETNTFNTTQMT